MNVAEAEYIITKAQASDVLPYHLLLLADENPQLIASYLPHSLAYVVKINGLIQGCCLLQPTDETGEIVNLAIEPAYQGLGLGRALLRHIKLQGKEMGMKNLLLKTGNSSTKQLALYQQEGFELIGVNYNYFLQAYPQPIWENNIQCKHQLVLGLKLS